MPNQKKKSNLDNLSAKIKHIYIELNRYSFFHNPSNVKMQDSRFIGREKLIERLKTILSNNETRSGAYLITGFRGVGKTTFVNRVVSEVTVQPSEKSKWTDFKSIFFYLLILMVYNENTGISSFRKDNLSYPYIIILILLIINFIIVEMMV